MWVYAAFVLSVLSPPSKPAELIPYYKGGKWGYADAARHLVIPAIYDKAARFKDGRARVTRGTQSGFIDTTGHEAVPVRYRYVEPFSEGLAAVGVDTPSGQSRFGYVDRDGKVIVPLEYDWVMPFADGVARIEKDRHSGLVDSTGKMIVPPTQYAFVGELSEGLAPVYEEHTEYIERFGFVDRAGRLVIPVFKKYSGGGPRWSEGRFRVRHKGKFGFIDKTGAEVVPTVYDSVGDYHDGHAAVTLDGKNGVVDLDGKAVFSDANGAPVAVEEDGLAAVQVGMQRAFVDKKGKTVLAPKYDWSLDGVCPDWRLSDGLRGVTLSGKHGFIDHTGAAVVPVRYDCTGPFSEGLAAVLEGELWGFVDKTGKVAIAPKYFRVDAPFESGFAYVTLRRKASWNAEVYESLEGYIDRQGTEFFEGPWGP